jgi:hypothetical protein
LRINRYLYGSFQIRYKISMNIAGRALHLTPVVDISASEKGILISRIFLICVFVIEIIANLTTRLLVFNHNQMNKGVFGSSFYYFNADLTVSNGNIRIQKHYKLALGADGPPKGMQILTRHLIYRDRKSCA